MDASTQSPRQKTFERATPHEIQMPAQVTFRNTGPDHNPIHLEHRFWRGTPLPSHYTSAVSLGHVPSLAHSGSRLSRARLERDGSLAGGRRDASGCPLAQADRDSQEDHGL